ncbi:MAG: apolipoprotein N-acyltransferase [Alphaproteobacteria bacterium]|nr:apolipoprotein N-acyltransferase [Alphaproteobacteria bacterium]
MSFSAEGNRQIIDLRERVAALGPWPARALALAAGLLSALAMAPIFAWPLLAIAFPAMVFLLDAPAPRPIRRAAFLGWLFGFGFFAGGLYWIGFPFTVDSDAHAWMIPFAVVLFPGGLALFYAAAFALARAAWTKGPERIAALAVTLGGLEYLRGHILTGFPWNLFSYAWAGFDAGLQSHALIGAYGVTLLTIALAAAPALLADRGRARRVALGLAAALFVMHLGYGALRLALADPDAPSGETIRIVQPNTPQNEKYVQALVLRNWQTLLELTRRPGLDSRKIVIWPEAAPPFVLSEEPVALEQIAGVLPGDTMLLTGAVRVDRAERKVYNSFHAVSGTGEIVATYDKSHLVPFGEYLPLRSYLEPLGITRLVQVPGDFKEGESVRTLSVPGVPPFSPLICYEIIFPDAVIEPENRPAFLLNVTDDSWFADTSGPRQHLAIARARAIEEGLPVIRAANTGISAIIDAYGRERVSLAYDSEGIIDGTLPSPLGPTLYAWAGDWLFAILWLAMGVPVLLARRRGAENPSQRH